MLGAFLSFLSRRAVRLRRRHAAAGRKAREFDRRGQEIVDAVLEPFRSDGRELRREFLYGSRATGFCEADRIVRQRTDNR